MPGDITGYGGYTNYLSNGTTTSVSYTHLDVYKRQYLDPSNGQMVKDRMVGQYYINPDGVYVP